MKIFGWTILRTSILEFPKADPVENRILTLERMISDLKDQRDQERKERLVLQEQVFRHLGIIRDQQVKNAEFKREQIRKTVSWPRLKHELETRDRQEYWKRKMEEDEKAGKLSSSEVLGETHASEVSETVRSDESSLSGETQGNGSKS